jgi:hypothetical protein
MMNPPSLRCGADPSPSENSTWQRYAVIAPFSCPPTRLFPTRAASRACRTFERQAKAKFHGRLHLPFAIIGDNVIRIARSGRPSVQKNYLESRSGLLPDRRVRGHIGDWQCVISRAAWRSVIARRKVFGRMRWMLDLVSANQSGALGWKIDVMGATFVLPADGTCCPTTLAKRIDRATSAPSRIPLVITPTGAVVTDHAKCGFTRTRTLLLKVSIGYLLSRIKYYSIILKLLLLPI